MITYGTYYRASANPSIGCRNRIPVIDRTIGRIPSAQGCAGSFIAGSTGLHIVLPVSHCGKGTGSEDHFLDTVAELSGLQAVQDYRGYPYLTFKGFASGFAMNSTG